ncbi:MAG: hypothetical protein JZU50_09075 [Desulfobulbaceae bacterium]|nr:hypothetical protein [Desulfobulbaceae bacterium]
MKTTQSKEFSIITDEQLKKYLEYASTDEARAVLFVKKHLNKASGHWIDIINCFPYQCDSNEDLEFKLVLCGIYARNLKPKYPLKQNFILNGIFNDKEYYLAVRAITWETAHTDISQQKDKGIEGDKFEIKGVKYNKNRGKYTEKPPWLNNPAWKDLDIHTLRGADRTFVEQFLAPPDWHYEIKTIRKISSAAND